MNNASSSILLEVKDRPLCILRYEQFVWTRKIRFFAFNFKMKAARSQHEGSCYQLES